MSKPKILVIGSNSFSGSHFVAEALRTGHTVWGVSRSREPDPIFLPYRWTDKEGGKQLATAENFSFQAIDLNSQLNSLLELVDRVQPELVVNFAAQGMVAESWLNPTHWYKTNLLTQVALHDALRHKKFLQKYVHVTTPEVYGSTDGGWIKEHNHFSPSTPYAVSRAACDLHLLSFYEAYGFPVVFTRAANVYGPGQQLYRIIPRAILSARTGKPMQLHGGGKSVRSFIHIQDVVRATLQLAKEGEPGSTWHLSTQESCSIKALVERICMLTNADFDKLVKIVEERLGKDQSYLLDSSSMRQVHDWSDQIPGAGSSGDTGLGRRQPGVPQEPALGVPTQVMKLLVTGGCGYKGSILIPLLLADGHTVISVDTQWFGNELPEHPQLTNLKLDVRETDAIPLEGVDAIIHLANIANDPAVELNPTLSWEVNVLASQQLADRAVRAGVKQFLFASSGSVYGIKEEAKVTEDLTLVPISVYNKTKMVAERVLLSYSEDMQVHCIRPATVCGLSPRMRLDVSVNMLTYQALVNGEITVFGGDQTRPNIHIKDIANIYRHFLKNRDIRSGCYNAGFENLKIIEIAKLVKEKTNANIKIIDSNDPRSYRQDSSKLVETGFKAEYSVEKAIDEIIKAYQDGKLPDGENCYTVKWMKKRGISST